MGKRIVVKVGSNVLTREDGKLDVTRMSAIVDQIVWLRKHDYEVILVSSGAVDAGRAELHVDHHLDSVEQRQLFSAIDIGSPFLLYPMRTTPFVPNSSKDKIQHRSGKKSIYSLSKPKLWIRPSRLRQSSFTLTQVCRLTLIPKKRSISCRANVAIFLSIAPPLPMTIPLWLSRSQ